MLNDCQHIILQFISIPMISQVMRSSDMKKSVPSEEGVIGWADLYGVTGVLRIRREV